MNGVKHNSSFDSKEHPGPDQNGISGYRPRTGGWIFPGKQRWFLPWEHIASLQELSCHFCRKSRSLEEMLLQGSLPTVSLSDGQRWGRFWDSTVGFGLVWAQGWNIHVRPARRHTRWLGLTGSLQDAGGRFWEYEMLIYGWVILASRGQFPGQSSLAHSLAQNVLLSETSGCSDGAHAPGKSQCSELTQALFLMFFYKMRVMMQ